MYESNALRRGSCQDDLKSSREKWNEKRHLRRVRDELSNHPKKRARVGEESQGREEAAAKSRRSLTVMQGGAAQSNIRKKKQAGGEIPKLP